MNAQLEDTIDLDAVIVERLLDNKWLARLQTITPTEFGMLTPSEQRTLAGRAERFRKRFEEIATWMNRNAPPPLEIPDVWRQRAVL